MADFNTVSKHGNVRLATEYNDDKAGKEFNDGCLHMLHYSCSVLMQFSLLVFVFADNFAHSISLCVVVSCKNPC